MHVIKMQLFSPSLDPFVSQRFLQKKPAISIPLKSGSLRSSMVSRVHNTPPGCSSCGKR
jgi:hypothetical protein